MPGRKGARRAGAALADARPSPRSEADTAVEALDLDEIVQMLSRAIRELDGGGDRPEARRQVDTLCRVLRTRRVLDSSASGSLSELAVRLLQEAGSLIESGRSA